MKTVCENYGYNTRDIMGISLVYIFQKYENQIYSYFTFIKSAASQRECQHQFMEAYLGQLNAAFSTNNDQ